MLTLTQIEAYVRAETGELDAKRVDSEQIKRWANFGQTKVQNDLMQIGFKAFTKTAFNTGASFTEPTDMLKHPNSIIDLQASTGGRAYYTINYTTPTANLTHTFRQPGTLGNSVSISLDGGTYSGVLASGAVACYYVGGTFYIDFGSGSTITQIVTGFNADPVYSQYFICSSTTGGSTVPVPSVGTNTTLANGTGNGYYPADEVSIENFNRISNNAYKAPSATSPKFARKGSPTGKLIEILPNSITYSKLEYYYRLADLSATTDTLGVPAELEELVILDVIKRVYEKTGNGEGMKKTVAEYEDKWKKYIDGYVGKRQSEISEKERLQSADINN